MSGRGSRRRVALVVVGPPGPAGPIGLTGPPGPAGSGSGGRYTHEQSVSAATWIVNHSLNNHPIVTIIIDGQLVLTDVTYNNSSQLSIVFATPCIGMAVCS